MVEALAGLPEQNVLLAEFLPQEVLGEMPSVSATRPPGKGGAGGGFGDPAASSLSSQGGSLTAAALQDGAGGPGHLHAAERLPKWDTPTCGWPLGLSAREPTPTAPRARRRLPWGSGAARDPATTVLGSKPACRGLGEGPARGAQRQPRRPARPHSQRSTGPPGGPAAGARRTRPSWRPSAHAGAGSSVRSGGWRCCSGCGCSRSPSGRRRSALRGQHRRHLRARPPPRCSAQPCGRRRGAPESSQNMRSVDLMHRAPTACPVSSQVRGTEHGTGPTPASSGHTHTLQKPTR